MPTWRLNVTRRQTAAVGDEAPAGEPSQGQLLAGLDEAARQHHDALLLTGGEPLLRPDLPELLAAARARGIAQIGVLTDAVALSSPARARDWQAAGVTALTVALPSEGRHARYLPQTLAGLRAALETDLAVTVRLSLRALTPPAQRMQQLMAEFGQLRRFELALPPERGRTSPPDLARLTAALLEAWTTAKRAKCQIALAADAPVAPCIVPVHGEAKRLLSAVLADTDRPPNRACAACATCALAPRCTVRAETLDACGGAQLARPIATARPYLRPGRSPGSRLRVVDDQEVQSFFHVDYDYLSDVSRPTSRIGIIYKCNQVCTFCGLADMDGRVAPAAVRTALDAAIARGSNRVILTGGEPTLSPDVIEHVRYAAALGFATVELQTNAVLLDRPGFAAKLKAAGLSSAQVSLHGIDAAISDRLTAAPGTHARTLTGIDNLLAAGVKVLLNHLIFKDNCHLLLEFIAIAAARWHGQRELLTIQFHSARNEFVDRAEGLMHIARYSDYAVALREAIDRGRALGLRVMDLQDPTGIPALCVLGADETYLGPILHQAQASRFHKWEGQWLRRVKACETCEVRDACMGIPGYYLDLHGDSEFHSLKRLA